jgi:hypothetical protein
MHDCVYDELSLDELKYKLLAVNVSSDMRACDGDKKARLH